MAFKRSYLLGIAAYAGLLVLAVLFYRERTIFIDIAFHLFVMAKDGGLAIQNYRFGAALTQIFPVLAIKFGLKMNTILLIYSCIFIIYYLVCYILCGLVFRNYRMALVLLFVNILFVTDSFYWIQSELQQGLAFLIVFLAYLSSLKPTSNGWLHIPIVTLFAVTAAFFHPLLVFPFAFSVAFFLLQKDIAKRWLWISFCIYLLAVLVKKVLFHTEYDDQAMSGIKNFVTLFPNYFRLYSNKTFLLACISKFYWLPVMGTAVCIVYFRQQAWLRLLLFGCFFGGYLLLINVSYFYPGVTAFYMENLYLPLGVLISLPFMYDVLGLVQLHDGRKAILTAIVVVAGLFRIYLAHAPYSGRLEMLESLLDKYRNQKTILAETPELRDKLMMTWATPYEFWILSTIRDGRTASIIIRENPNDVMWAAGNKAAFIGAWGLFPYNELPPRYFKFRDTTSSYELVKNTE